MHDDHRQSRSGLTLLEVVTVLFCMVVLLALFLPTIRITRGASGRTRCLNNLRNVSVAIHNFASSNKSRLPAQAYYPGTTTADGTSWQSFEGHSWVVELTPYLDHNGMYDRWNRDQPWDSTFEESPGNGSNSSIADLFIPALTCPQDASAFQVKGGLSYALNCGIGDLDWHAKTGLRDIGRVESGQHFMVEPFDWNGNGILPPEDLEDAAVTRDFTLFWPDFSRPVTTTPAPKPMTHHRLGEIYDGTSNTVMLGENINAGHRPGRAKPSWADPQVCSNGLVLPIDPSRVSPTAMADDNSLAALVISTPLDPAVNASRDAGEGKAPFMNSAHQGVGVIAFCDGSVTTISDEIDMSVYVRLLTPCGTRERKIEGFVPETPFRSDEF